MNDETKLKELGLHTKVLLQLHLEDPQKWDPTEIVSKLFDKFEALGLEEDLDGE